MKHEQDDLTRQTSLSEMYRSAVDTDAGVTYEHVVRPYARNHSFIPNATAMKEVSGIGRG